MDNNLHLPLATLSHLIRTGDISPVELIESTFTEIDRRNPQLNAFITLFWGQNLESARQAEGEIRDGRVRGTLHGIPIALKDIIHVGGTPTTCGSKFFAIDPSQPDATVTSKLKDAGVDNRWEDQFARICLRRDDREPALWHNGEPVEHVACCRGIEWRLGGCCRHRLLCRRTRHRHRRIGSHSSGDVRGCRAETHLRTN